MIGFNPFWVIARAAGLASAALVPAVAASLESSGPPASAGPAGMERGDWGRMEAFIELGETPDGVRLTARVNGPGARQLAWRFEVEAGSTGGRSRTVQSGKASGGGSVSSVVLGPGSKGRATLSVQDESGRTARHARDFGS